MYHALCIIDSLYKSGNHPYNEKNTCTKTTGLTYSALQYLQTTSMFKETLQRFYTFTVMNNKIIYKEIYKNAVTKWKAGKYSWQT